MLRKHRFITRSFRTIFVRALLKRERYVSHLQKEFNLRTKKRTRRGTYGNQFTPKRNVLLLFRIITINTPTIWRARISLWLGSTRSRRGHDEVQNARNDIHIHTNIILGGKMICHFNTAAVETIGHSENRRPYTVFKQIRNSPITRITDVCCVRAIMRPVNTYIIYLK